MVFRSPASCSFLYVSKVIFSASLIVSTVVYIWFAIYEFDYGAPMDYLNSMRITWRHVNPPAVSETSGCKNNSLPCTYLNTVDFRIIVLTYNRAQSLRNCIAAINDLNMTQLHNKQVAMEIWIDRSRTNQVHQETYRVASNTSFSHGEKQVHVQERHMGVVGQWLHTWRPRRNTRERALFIEDDVIVSPFALLWLDHAWRQYKDRKDLAGITVQGPRPYVMQRKMTPIKRPLEHAVFMYKLPSPWGLSPEPLAWRAFQDWYLSVRGRAFQPLVPGLLPSNWYLALHRKRRSDSMWTMWFMYFLQHTPLYIIYPNLHDPKQRKWVMLCANTAAKGEHTRGRAAPRITDSWRRKNLLMTWRAEYVRFPRQPRKYDFDGQSDEYRFLPMKSLEQQQGLGQQQQSRVCRFLW